MDLAVATPGRLLELLELGEILLDELKVLILDEADKILSLGFSEQMSDLLNYIPKNCQNILFSATLSEKVEALAKRFMRDPEVVRVEKKKENLDLITQRVVLLDSEKRRKLLEKILLEENWDSTMVFMASKRAAKNLCGKLTKSGLKAGALHGDLKQSERSEVLEDFKKRKINILVATDIASRGIDIEGLSAVINFDLPRSTADYIHRIGRTGRAGNKGTAISFIDSETEAHFKLIEKRYKFKLDREQIAGYEISKTVSAVKKGPQPVKGKRKSKKDKLREAQKASENK